MTTTTRRLRRPDEEWAHTRITATRLRPLEPRDERVRIARPLLGSGGDGARRPTPLDVRLAQAKGSVRLVSSGSNGGGETLREPEIVDLAGAAPGSWTSKIAMKREVCPPYPPPPPPPPKPRRALPPPSVASRQSEMSFGILDYYIHDPSPLPSPMMPDGGVTPVVDSAIKRFDFGLGGRRAAGEPSDVQPGADEEMELIPLSPRPFEDEDDHRDKPDQPQPKKKYSLFPAVQEVTPSAHRLAQVINDSPVDSHQNQTTITPTPTRHQEPRTTSSSWRPRLLSGAKMTTPLTRQHRSDTLSSSSPPNQTISTTTITSPTTTLPSPFYHPRNPSLSFPPSSRLPSTSISSSNSTSSTNNSSTTNNTRRIPLRILSSSSTATATTLSRSSISTSPGSTFAGHGQGQQKPLLSRWSEDTALASPTTAAAVLNGCRDSFGSGVFEGRGEWRVDSGGGYPPCFFEEDEDVPLRRRRMGRARGRRWWVCCG